MESNNIRMTSQLIEEYEKMINNEDFKIIVSDEKELNDKLLIDIMYFFEREMEHNIDYLDGVGKILEANNFNSLSHMVMLIKE